ncbi:MAG: glycosyltransferase family 4 protein, partial [Sphingomonadaceae bacterium]|nr:glycosyltransferase family 4 protein [Sphingomonadaceae bacterium]
MDALPPGLFCDCEDDEIDVGDVARPARVRRIALIGNSLPRKCGIATFTTDCFNALRQSYPEIDARVYAMEDSLGGIAYPPEVARTIREQDFGAYLEAARDIDDWGADAVWVQHEYGIFGGLAGEHLLALLDRVAAPVIVTLHTVLEEPDADQRRVLERLLDRAGRVMVMAEKGAEILRRVYDADERKILVIPHGVPDRLLADPESIKPRFGFSGRKVILTFGLLAPNKGIETMIMAMPEIVAGHPESLYVVLGSTHPHLVAHEGESHRERLVALAETLGVADNVAFLDEFADHERLLDYLQAADVYVTPYLNPAQITSGTLSYAVGMGKAIVSTPYVHATEALDEGHGVLVPFGDSGALASEITRLLNDDVARRALSERAYARGRTMLWPRLA